MIDLRIIQGMVAAALSEDVGSGDVSADVIPEDLPASAIVLTREDGILCGTAWVDEVFRSLDSGVTIRWSCRDGSALSAGTEICSIQGRARALLTGERVALNFLQTLSGTATRARRYVDRVRHTGAIILDTRKTLPGWRHAQKYAVACGGGTNHRMGLFDAILLKENHIAAAGSITAAVTEARKCHPRLPLEIEVERLPQIDEALSCNVDRILLDNFVIGDIASAVRRVGGRCPLEVSGGVTLDNVGRIAETGVSFISIGDITKNVTALDLSLRFRGLQGTG
ncbi:MAG: carboxylating nicotinate-nucleotide diphosphorylase [Acidiferrobacteraceae bacterium]